MNALVRTPWTGASVRTLANRIGATAARSLRLELETWPKPGLVSLVDNGSHADMDAGTFRRSIAALEPFFADLGAAGAIPARMPELRRIGLAAEAAMLAATGGINTHRGAIFGLGLLCAAAGVQAASLAGAGPAGGSRPSCATLGDIVRTLWGAAILNGPAQPGSHGAEAGRRYGVGGARFEAAMGFPSLYGIGLPALWAGLASGDGEAARVQACFALIAALEDTNLLHRGGPEGLSFARAAARRFIDEGGVGRAGWRDRAVGIHRAFVERRLSPGGSADLLAMSLFVQAMESAGEVRP